MTLTEFLLARIAEDEAAISVSELPPPAAASRRRVLAECEVKRWIVETFADMDTLPEGERTGQRVTLRWACQLLALPHADHPDYRQEWQS